MLRVYVPALPSAVWKVPSMVIVRALESALEPPAALTYWSTIFCGSWACALPARTVRQKAVVIANLCVGMAFTDRNAIAWEKFRGICKIGQAYLQPRSRWGRRACHGARESSVTSVRAYCALGRLRYFSYRALCLLSSEAGWPLMKR